MLAFKTNYDAYMFGEAATNGYLHSRFDFVLGTVHNSSITPKRARASSFSRHIDPLFQTSGLILPPGEVSVQALFGAKLLKFKSKTDKAETATAHRAARLRFRAFGNCLAHSGAHLGQPGCMREHLRKEQFLGSENNCNLVDQPYLLSLAPLGWPSPARTP
jgi:hypothetical protein